MSRSSRAYSRLTALLVGLLAGCSESSDSPDEAQDKTNKESLQLSADQTFRAMVSNEKTIAELVPSLNRLSRAVRDMALPGELADDLFFPRCDRDRSRRPGKGGEKSETPHRACPLGNGDQSQPSLHPPGRNLGRNVARSRGLGGRALWSPTRKPVFRWKLRHGSEIQRSRLGKTQVPSRRGRAR